MINRDLCWYASRLQYKLESLNDIRDTYPYGCWKTANGDYFVFNRKYKLIRHWRRVTGKTVIPRNPDRWLHSIIKEGYYHDGNGLAYRDEKYLDAMEDVLAGWDEHDPMLPEMFEV